MTIGLAVPSNLAGNDTNAIQHLTPVPLHLEPGDVGVFGFVYDGFGLVAR